MPPLTLTPLPGLPLVQRGDDLAALIAAGLAAADVRLADGDILVVAQKIVSKSEGRFVDLRQVTASPLAESLAGITGKTPAMVEVVLSESREVVRTGPNTLIVEHRLGFVCANAGVDRSNVGPQQDDVLLLLPHDPDASAERLRAELGRRSGAQIGVIINDSHGRAWRLGTVGVAIGAAGVPGLLDLRGKPDLFDYALQITQVGLADELAAAASLVMGQADEGRPVVHIRGLPYPLRDGNARELLRPRQQDLFR